MRKNNVKMTINDSNTFKPIKVKLEFTIKTKEQLDNLRLEFSEGIVRDNYSDCSYIFSDIVEKLKEL